MNIVEHIKALAAIEGVTFLLVDKAYTYALTSSS
jgi:hypothetical protein